MKNWVWLLSFLLIAAGCEKSGPAPRFFTIGTGGLSGVYYPVGQGIARLLNQGPGYFKATAQSTGGSVFNVNAVLGGDLDLGIAQSDRQYQAYHGLAEWQGLGPQTHLRSIAALHSEAVTLVASVNSGIQSPKDLKGKRVNLGNPGSGQLGNAQDLLETFGIGLEELDAQQIKAVEAPGLLQDERLDAFFYTVGHPNGNLKEASSGRIKVRLVPLSGPEIEALLIAKPFYAPTVIYKKHYPQAIGTEMIPTFGVKATLVASVALDEEVAYLLAKTLVENFEVLKALHPAFEGMTKQDLFLGLSAPLHKGAYRYYQEAGLTPPTRLAPP